MRVIVLSLLVASAPALAEPVFAGVAARETASALAERARARVAELLEGRADNVSSARAATTDESAVQEVKRRVQTARALFLEVDFDGALAELDEALVVFEDGPAFSAGESFREVLAEMLMLRAVILNRLGRDPEMRATLARLAAALPTFRPDPAEVPPALVREHSKLRKSRKGKLKLVVKSTTPGEVTVDGIERGQTPLTLERLVPGVHYLSVRGEGEVFRRVLRLRKPTTGVDVALGDPRVTAARVVVGALESGVEDPAKLKGMLGPLGDDVIAGVIQGPTLLLGRVQRGAITHMVEVPLVPTSTALGVRDADLAGLFVVDAAVDETRLDRWLGRAQEPSPIEIPGEPPEEEGSGALLIAGGVAGFLVLAAATAGVVLLAVPPSPPGFRLRVEVE